MIPATEKMGSNSMVIFTNWSLLILLQMVCARNYVIGIINRKWSDFESRKCVHQSPWYILGGLMSCCPN